jgi:hypothetical protein
VGVLAIQERTPVSVTVRLKSSAWAERLARSGVQQQTLNNRVYTYIYIYIHIYFMSDVDDFLQIPGRDFLQSNDSDNFLEDI